jgi:co-chaperonin GroES (HSP10)
LILFACFHLGIVMRFNIWRKWLQLTIQNIRRGRRSLRKRLVRSFKPQFSTLEDRVTPATYTPTTTSDLTFTSVNPATGAITGGTGNGQITLRSAFIAANANAGTDTINIPAGTYTLSLTGAEGIFTPNDGINDLDVTQSVNIVGAGPATTIIQAGTVASTNGIDGNGIDKVLEINQAGVAGIHTTISGVTIRNGKNTIAANSGDDLGGGIAWYGSITNNTDIGTLAIDNCVISNNVALNNNGGGISVDTGPNTLDLLVQTHIAISNTTISNNKSNLGTTQSGNPPGGGGLSIRGNLIKADISNSVIDGNTAGGPTVGAAGGGIQIYPIDPNYVGFVNLHHVTVSNNNSSYQAGGIYINAFSPNYNFAIDQGSRITGNTAVGNSTLQSGAADTGGILFASANANTTLTIQDSLIDANVTANSSPDQRGGAGITAGLGRLVVKNTTISGNLSSSDAGGIKVDNNAVVNLTNVTITNNHAQNDNAGAGSGGGIKVITGTVTMDNTIVAGNFNGSGTTTADNIAGNVAAASSFNLVGTGGAGGLANGTNSNQIGVLNPGIAPLANNGGPTLTHGLLGGSPAIDAGSNAKATAAGLTTDQRRTGFTRTLDGGDAGTVQTTDIGALEQQPNVQDILDQTINEDTTLNTSFNFGDITVTGGIDNVTVTSSNTALVPNANISLGGGSNSVNNNTTGNLTLALTPVANAFGTTTITVTATDIYNGISFTSTDTFVLTVNPVADPPSITTTTTNEDTQTTTGLVVTRNAVDGAEVTHFKITNITNGTLFKNNGTTPINNNDFITFAEANAGLKFTPAANLFSPGTTFSFDVAGACSVAGAGLGLATTATLTVLPVADPPGITPTTTNEDTQSSSGLVISRNAVDGTEVTHFKITGITGGTLFQNDGTTPINNNDFITFAQGSTGLRFTPAANLFSPSTTFGFTAQGATSSGGAGLGVGTAASITVNPIADTPSVTNATTNEDTQSTSGLVISRNAVDGIEVTHFKITSITGGTLFQSNGTTPINSGDFITFAQGNAGLKFTPTANLFSPSTTFSFGVQASTSNANGGLGGSVVTATITVNPIADTPAVTNATTNEDTQTTSGLVITRNAVDSTEVTHFKITAISNGTLFQNDGTTPINNGDFITVAQGTAGLKFTPSANFFGTGSFAVQASLSNSNPGLGGGSATATITVNPVADTPSVTNAATTENTQTTSGLVISRNAADSAEVTHFKITNIINGTLFQNDGTTVINPGDFITFGQGSAGLKFTPTTNLFSPTSTFSFDVQASVNNTNGGIGGGTATATITVSKVIHSPGVTNSSTNEDTQTTSGLVITRNALDGAEVTHFKITNITNGTLFQNDGTTPINSGDFVTSTQGNAGLKFTPSPNFFGTGSFDVQASLSNTNPGLGGGVVTASITVNAIADTPSVTNATTNEDVQTTSGLVISRNPADNVEVTHFKVTNITNGTLFQNDGTTVIPAGTFITFAQGSAGLKFTPNANFSGAGSFQVQASTINSNAGLGGGIVTATITVNAVADTPSVTNATTNEDTQTSSGLVVTRNAGDDTEVTHFQVTNVTNGTLFQSDGTTPINSGDFITVAQGNAGLKFTPSPNFFGTGSFQVQASTSNSNAGLGGGVVTATITVNPIADTPSVTNATTNEDVQTTSGLVISRNPADSVEVTHFQITNITNGTLFQSDGTTVIPAGTFITFAQGNAGLKFTPNANFSGAGSFDVQASTSNVDAGLGGGVVTATITVNAVADTPSVTNATTSEDVQTTGGLVISRNPADSVEVTHFQITNITNGTLFQSDGTTPINSGDFITVAQGNAGLKFTPSPNFFGTGSFQVQASTSNSNGGLGGGVVTATITVNPIADTPSVTNATTNEDVQTTSGLVISRNPADSVEVTHFKITNITNGTLFQNDGTTVIPAGTFITFAQGNAGLKFTPNANFFGTGSFDIQASTANTNVGLGGGVVTATITVNAVADTPSVTNATTTVNTQTTSGLVVTVNPVDGASVTGFQITGITNGTLFLNDGTTAISNGNFISVGHGNAGLKFTPALNLANPGTTFGFDVQATTDGTASGLAGGLAHATITVGDQVAPDTIIDSGPSQPFSTSSSATFTFHGTDNVTPLNLTFESNLDNAGFMPASSPLVLNGLAEGSHTLLVRAKDLAGNVDASPASYTWNVDTQAPQIGISAPSRLFTNQATSVTYTVTYTDVNLAAVTLANSDIVPTTTLTAAANVNVSATADPAVWTVTFNNATGNGTIGFTIKAGTARDAANNFAGASSASATFEVDNVKPSVSIGLPSVVTTKAGPVKFVVTVGDTNLVTPVVLTPAQVQVLGVPAAVTGDVVVAQTDATHFTVTVSNIRGGQGTIAIQLPAGLVADQAGNTSDGPVTSATVQVTGLRKLNISIAPPPLLVRLGAPLTYSITYTNKGTQAADNVSITVSLPAGATFNPTASTAGWTALGGGKFKILVGSVAVGAKGKLKFAVVLPSAPPSDGQAVFTASITDDLAAGKSLVTRKVVSKFSRARYR